MAFDLHVSQQGKDHYLTCNSVGKLRCAVGPVGILSNKHEGDGATPAGRFLLRRVLYRADRVSRPQTELPVMTIQPHDGWCDDVKNPAYNRPIRVHPKTHISNAPNAEYLWRSDHLYDICVILDHNDNPAIPGKGSAVFFHLAHDDYRPTQGCVGIKESHMRAILKLCTLDSYMHITL